MKPDDIVNEIEERIADLRRGADLCRRHRLWDRLGPRRMERDAELLEHCVTEIRRLRDQTPSGPMSA